MFLTINLRKFNLRKIILLIFVFTVFIGSLSYIFLIFKPDLTQVSKVDFKVVIDPGHGSIDTGTHHGDIYEKNINLSIGRYLETELNNANITTIMTRNEDKLYHDSRREDIRYRPRVASENNADLFVSIHVNNFPSAQPSGSQIFYKLSSDKSKNLATCVKKELVKLRSQNDRALVAGDYYVLNNTDCPSILIETGFLSNPEDRKKLTTPDYQKSLAKAIKDGIISYMQSHFKRFVPDQDKNSKEKETNNNDQGKTTINLHYLTVKENKISFAKKPFSYPAGAILNKELNQLKYNEILALAALRQLQNPPENALPVLAPSVKVLSVKIDNGTVMVDFSQEIKTNFQGGAGTELKLIQSICKTLRTIPGIDKVKIFIEGKTGQTIGGHIILDKSFR